VPVTLGIERERRVDPDRDYVLVVIPRLESRKENGAVASVRRIARRCSHRSGETLVIAYIRDIESGRGVPLPVTLRREPLARVPRRIRVTVKVDNHVLGITHLDRGHRTRDHRAASIHHNDASQRRERGSGLPQYRGAS
jgi:hypothetical protein